MAAGELNSKSVTVRGKLIKFFRSTYGGDIK